MLYALVVVVVVAVLALVGGWVARRRQASDAWNRELEAAFAVADRREMPTRPVL
jgi:hypothetical protein